MNNSNSFPESKYSGKPNEEYELHDFYITCYLWCIEGIELAGIEKKREDSQKLHFVLYNYSNDNCKDLINNYLNEKDESKVAAKKYAEKIRSLKQIIHSNISYKKLIS